MNDKLLNYLLLRKSARQQVWHGTSKRRSKSPRVFSRLVKNGFLKYDAPTGIYVNANSKV